MTIESLKTYINSDEFHKDIVKKFGPSTPGTFGHLAVNRGALNMCLKDEGGNPDFLKMGLERFVACGLTNKGRDLAMIIIENKPNPTSVEIATQFIKNNPEVKKDTTQEDKSDNQETRGRSNALRP